MELEKKHPWDWLLESLSMRNGQALLYWFRRFYEAHHYRYYAWDQKVYRLWVWTAGIVMGLLVLAPAVWLGRSSYLRHEESRMVVLARTFQAAGDYRKASASAGRALQINPADLSACRIMAEITAASHSPTVLDWWQRVAEIEPTLENKLALAAAGLNYQSPPYPLTTQTLAELAATAVNNATYQEMAAKLAMSTGLPGEAETHFEAAAKLDPANRQYTLDLALLQLSMAGEVKKTQARTVLETLGTDPKLGSCALRALVTDRLAEHDVAAANGYSTRLLATPEATLADRLQNLGILKLLNSRTLGVNLQAVQQQAMASATDVAAVSAWMQANDLQGESLQWLESLPNQLLGQMPVELALANAYMQTGNWHALLDFTSGGNWEDRDFLRLAMVSHAWSQLGVPTVAESNWGEAVNKASEHFEAMTNLLGLAQCWQLNSEQADLRQRIVRQFPQ